MKTCRRCNDEWPLDEFPANARTRDGLSSWCRECHNNRTRQYRADKRSERETAVREAYLARSAELRKAEEEWRRRAEKQRQAERKKHPPKPMPSLAERDRKWPIGG